MAQSNTRPWIGNAIFVVAMHVIGFLSPFILAPEDVPWQTWLLSIINWHLATLGITAGYHRLWSHRAFEAHWLTRLAFAWMGMMGFQGSIKWWVLRHRLHHRWTDSNEDPYNAKQGLWFSHMGWIFQRPVYKKMPLIDISDLTKDPIVRFQHKYYIPLTVFFSLIFPTLLGFCWGDALGGYLYAGVVTRILIWHVTFLINSLAHYVGDRPYSPSLTARGGLFIAMLTQGEGYHNFHHAFPSDYRNGHKWYHYDPTKWMLWALSKVGLIWKLNETPEKVISATRLFIENKKSNLHSVDLPALGPIVFNDANVDLPWMTRSEFETLCKNDSDNIHMIISDDVVRIPIDFVERHPGGSEILEKYRGRNATKAFYGGLNQHLEAAQWMMHHMRVAKLVRDPNNGLILSKPTMENEKI